MQIQSSQNIIPIHRQASFKPKSNLSETFVQDLLFEDVEGVRSLIEKGLDPNKPITLNEKMTLSFVGGLLPIIHFLLLFSDEGYSTEKLLSNLLSDTDQSTQLMNKLTHEDLQYFGEQLEAVSEIFWTHAEIQEKDNSLSKEEVCLSYPEEEREHVARVYDDHKGYLNEVTDKLIEFDRTRCDSTLIPNLTLLEEDVLFGTTVHPLQIAVDVPGNFELVQLLLENGANLRDAKNIDLLENQKEQVFCFLNASSNKKYIEFASLFQQYGLSIEEMLDHSFSNVEALLNAAKEQGNDELVEFLEQNITSFPHEALV